MDQETQNLISRQLRRPHGDMALEIGERMNKGNRDLNLLAIEALKLHSGDAVLEIGMGNGFFVPNILAAAEGIHYTGCDYSEEMVAEAQKRNADAIAAGRASFHLGEAAALPFPDAHFDTVFTVNTIYFWDDPAEVLAEIRRVLKPEGKFIVALRPKGTMNKYAFTREGFTMYARADVELLVTTHGFAVGDVLELEEPGQEIEGEKIAVRSLVLTLHMA